MTNNYQDFRVEVMFCLNCGVKLKQGIKFCTSCGKAARSKSLEEEKAREEKPIAPVTTKATSGSVLFVISLGALAVSLVIYFKATKVEEKTTPGEIILQQEKPEELSLSLSPSTSPSSTPEKKAEIQDLSALKDIELEHLDEAQEIALLWADDARLVYYYVSSDPEKRTTPYMNYRFYSETKDKNYEVVWYSSGDIKEKEKEENTKKELTPFPPSLTLQQALALAMESLRETGFDQTITTFSGHSRGGSGYWWLTLKVDRGTQTLRKFVYKVYFDQRVVDLSDKYGK